MTGHTLFLILKSIAASISSNALIVSSLASSIANRGVALDSTCMFGSYLLKNKILNGERAFILKCI